MDLELEGKVAIVAAGTSGLGLATATSLLREGATVSVCGRDPARLERALTALRGLGAGNAEGESVDLLDHGAVDRWVNGVAAAHGRLDIVVASSGGPPVGPSPEFTLGDYRAAIDTCVLPLIATARAGLPHVRQSPAGRLLFICSYIAKYPLPHFPLSSSSRPAVLGFAKSLTYELRGTPTTVNVLAPGVFLTPALDPLSEAELAEHVADATLERAGRPEELGDLIAFLASERASYITGSVITVDGGASRSLV
jgi:3-oxoacyl-[acyl-carrier protein] reductase